MTLDRYRFALGSAESARWIRRRIASLGAILAACLRILESEILLFINTLWLAGPLPCGLVPFAVAARAIG